MLAHQPGNLPERRLERTTDEADVPGLLNRHVVKRFGVGFEVIRREHPNLQRHRH